LFFRGQIIWEAIMNELLSIGMSKAKQVKLWPQSNIVLFFLDIFITTSNDSASYNWYNDIWLPVLYINFITCIVKFEDENNDPIWRVFHLFCTWLLIFLLS
jgi:hypothetical protein